jgi:hypothetical protein
MPCACGRTIVPDPAFVESVWSATSYATCVYRCQCGRGYSNAKSAKERTCITDAPERNVPAEVTDGLQEVLLESMNVLNRAAKREKFCFATSEDAVTWTIFRWLADVDSLALVLQAAGLRTPEGHPELLLWGAPVRGGTELQADLIAVCDELGEDPLGRSEPDVVIAWPGDLAFVEVKYQAPNDVKPGYPNFRLYTERADIFALPAGQVAATGYYELVRNWRIGVALAESSGRAFALINLGPRRLAGRTPGLANTFKTSPGRAFASVSWSDLLAAIAADLDPPRWLSDFIAERELSSRWS